MSYDKTEVAVSKSQDAIRRLIKTHQGTGVVLISHPPREGFEALMLIGEITYQVRIIATARDVSKDKNGVTRRNSSLKNAIEQEERRVWRVLYWHLKALFEAADSGVIDIRDVILPYIVIEGNITVAERLKPQMPQLMTTPAERLLTA